MAAPAHEIHRPLPTQRPLPAPHPVSAQRPVPMQQRPLRLTARGRRVVRIARWSASFAVLVAIAVLAVLLASALLAPGAVAGDWSATTTVEEQPPTVEVVVAPGDTLWGLAQRHAPDRDPRDFVAEVYRINDLPESGLVRAGERLLLPVG